MCLDIIFYSRQPINGVMICRITCLTVACSVIGKLMYHRPIATDGIAKFCERKRKAVSMLVYLDKGHLTHNASSMCSIKANKMALLCRLIYVPINTAYAALANLLWYTNLQKCPHGKKQWVCSFKLPTHQLHRSHPTVINLLLQLLHHDECFYYGVMMFANNGLPPAMYRRPAKVIISAHS